MPEPTRKRFARARRLRKRSALRRHARQRHARRRLGRLAGRFPVVLLAVGFVATLAWTLFLFWAAYRLMSFVLA